MRTRAAFTAAVGTAAVDGSRRAVSRAAMEASGSSPAGAGPTTSVKAAVARRVARATAAGRRSERQRIGRPAHDQRPSHALERRRQRAGTEIGRRPVPRLLGLPEQLGHLFEACGRRQIGGGPAAVDRAELLVELRHRRRDGGQAGGRLAAAPAAGRQPLDLVQVEEAARAGPGRGAIRAGPG